MKNLEDWKSVKAQATELKQWIEKPENKIKSSISESCLKSYKSKWKRLKEKREEKGQEKSNFNGSIFSDNLGTFRLEKSAINYFHRKSIETLIKSAFSLQEKGNFEEAIQSLEAAQKHKVSLDRWESAAKDRENSGNFIKRKSKVSTIKGLEQNWQGIFFEKLQNENLKKTWALLSVTGCRPCELLKGIKVEKEVIDGKETLIFTIQNAKNPKSDNQWRRLEIIPQNPLFDYLNGLVGQIVKPSYSNASNMSKAIVRQGERLEIDGLSPYSFRHAFGSDLKATYGANDEWVSVAMGHTDPKAAERYGRGAFSSGCVTLVRATNAKGGLSRPPKTPFFKAGASRPAFR